MSIPDQFRSAFFVILLMLTSAAYGSTTALARAELPLGRRLWAFVPAGGRPAIGDVILCRSDAADPASPWFITQVLAVESDGSVFILKPIGKGISTLVQLPASQVVDIARPLKGPQK